MVAKKLKELFDPIANLNIQTWENFADLGTVLHFPKETILKEAHTTERYLNFLLSGSGGNLIWTKNNFVCIDIAFENDFINDYMSFVLQKPTPIEVRLFEDSHIFRISIQNFQKTFESGNYGEKVSRLAAESALIDKQQQQIDLLTKTAKERYMELISTKKGIAGIQLKYLASYLGITPQSLSRIRAGKI